MTTRWVGMAARLVEVDVARAGDEIGEDEVAEQEIALVIEHVGNGDALALEGTPTQVRLMLEQALEKVKATRLLPDVNTGWSAADGLPCVQINTEDEGPVRVFVNDAVVYEADPHQPGLHELVYEWRQIAENLRSSGGPTAAAHARVYEGCAARLNNLIGGGHF